MVRFYSPVEGVSENRPCSADCFSIENAAVPTTGSANGGAGPSDRAAYKQAHDAWTKAAMELRHLCGNLMVTLEESMLLHAIGAQGGAGK
jgi:hypothetical protein